MTTATTQDKYKLILQAAIEVIAERGLFNTSISDIVKKAGVAQGTFYLYFKSKNALVPAIAQNLISITMDRIVQTTRADHKQQDFHSFLKVFVMEVYNITDEYKDVISLCYSGLAFDYSMELWESVYQPYYEWLERELCKGTENKELISLTNLQWTSKLIINLVENAAERFYIGRDQDMTKEESMEEVLKFIERSIMK